MKKGGWGIFQVPINYESESTYEDSTITDPKEREKHFWQKDHVRLYGKDYPIKLEKAGFKIEIFNPRTDLKNLNYQKMRLNPDELVYIAISNNEKKFKISSIKELDEVAKAINNDPSNKIFTFNGDLGSGKLLNQAF